MKRLHGWIGILTDAVLIACAALAVVCAIPSAFEIPFELNTLIGVCAIGALILSCWMHLPRAGIAFGAVFLTATVAYGVFDRKAIVDGARVLWYSVLKPLSLDFSFLPVPEPVGEVMNPTAAVTALLIIAAAVFGMITAYALIRGRLLLLTILLPLPPFLLSLIYTNMPPALWTAFLLLIYCGGALVGHGLRKNSAETRGMLTLIVLVTAVALGFALRTLSPADAYQPIPFEQRQEMLGKSIGEIQDTVLSWFRRNPKSVDLDSEGVRKESDKTDFSINVTAPGSYLLRMRSYGHYADNRWLEADEYEGDFHSMTALSSAQRGGVGMVSIRDAYIGDRITPYAFLEDVQVLVGETRVHAQGRTAYVWEVYHAVDPRASHTVGAAEQAYLAYAAEQYTMPAGEEKDALLHILSDAGVRKSADPYDTALSVAAFVRDSGTYTLTPGETPAKEDFVRYFLTQSHRGYCVHFASATTALLQALDIPARYTVGYNVNVPVANVWTDVPEKAAHAWTEVFVKGTGWIPVESTAGFGTAFAQQGGSGGSAQVAAITPEPTGTPEPIEPPEPTPTPENTERPSAPPLPKTDGTEAPTEQPTSAAQPGQATEGKPIGPGTGGGTVIREREPRRISPWWLLLLLIPAGLAVWISAGGMVRRRRKHAFLRKNARKGILEMARYYKRLERYGAEAIPDLDAWAEEAAFSNHPMTAERRELYHLVCVAQQRLWFDEPFKRFFARWILFLI